MKIGILTFHRAENFGAVLQLYALQTYLKSLGNHVEVIDYRCAPIETHYRLLDFRVLFRRKNVFVSICIILANILAYRKRKTRKDKYKDFLSNKINISSPHITNNLINSYDAIIAGSDQLWNTSLTNGVDNYYFLNFESFKGKKITYAISSESYCFDYYIKEKDVITNCLKNIDKISVRENLLAQEMRKYTDKNIEIVLDPSFLLNREYYQSLISCPLNYKYVLVYHLHESKINIELAQQIAKNKNLEVIEIHAGNPIFLGKGFHITDPGPDELLSYIYHAEYVVTTSFHGVAFSIIFEKDFYSIASGSNMRQKALLTELGLNDRLVYDPQQVDLSKKIDYGKVNIEIEKLKTKSKWFLEEALKM